MLATLLFVFITVHNLHDTNAAVKRRESEELIIFPDGVGGDINKFGIDEEPIECKNKNYCTVKTSDYPQETFNKMFKGTLRANRHRRTSGDSSQDAPSVCNKAVFQPSLVLESMLSNRQGDPDEKDDCESIVSYDPLYKVRDKRNSEWRYVVQAPEENYVQKVRLETCTNPGSLCFNALPLAMDIKTLCVQKYSKWELLVSKGGNETEKIEVELPVCCLCKYKQPSVEVRFGVPSKQSPTKKPATKSN
ncbi:uncharacterized protein [Battus philenor]|uniref:uncharacterized protein isoform X1 n=1 Tax=Battus philenor TaxID=42288 RepID=UPI0035D065FB